MLHLMMITLTTTKNTLISLKYFAFNFRVLFYHKVYIDTNCHFYDYELCHCHLISRVVIGRSGVEKREIYSESMIFIGPFVLITPLLATLIWFLITKFYIPLFAVKMVPKITELPIVTSTGQIVNSVEELDMHLEFLQHQFEEKEKELENYKVKVVSTQENLKTIDDTANEVKKYYMKLKSEVMRNEKEHDDLKYQIEDYKSRQNRLREEVNQNVKYYTELLNNIDNRTAVSSNDEYEVVGKIPFKSCPSQVSDKYSII